MWPPCDEPLIVWFPIGFEQHADLLRLGQGDSVEWPLLIRLSLIIAGLNRHGPHRKNEASSSLACSLTVNGIVDGVCRVSEDGLMPPARPTWQQDRCSR